jgi:uncharacterized repeat protein (TIGR01451 family)
MTKLKRSLRAPRSIAFAAICLLVAGVVGLAAQRQLALRSAASGRPVVKMILSGTVERSTGTLRLSDVAEVSQGDVLKWQITSMNEGQSAARNYVAVGQIPKNTDFIAGSATAEGNADIAYSIDGGKNFSATPMLEERQADGNMKRVPAPVAMYTQVRYEWATELAAGNKLNAFYKVRVK